MFKELEAEPRITFQDLIKSAGSQKKRKAEGYPDDMSVLRTKVPASLFLSSDSPAALCQNAYEVMF